MRAIRRVLQVVAFVGTLMVGVLALALIASQTPWFRDWLRRYIVRESKQYLNGQLTIGHLDGNLLFGVDLSDVAVDVSGERVVALKTVAVDYNVFHLISGGLVIDQIKVDQPALHLQRDANGWNVARLMKPRPSDPNKKGSAVSLPDIQISDATLTVDDATQSGVKIPRRISDLDVKARVEYAPEAYSVHLEHLSFRGAEPDFSVQQLAGNIASKNESLFIEGLKLHTPATTLTIDGVVEKYLTEPVLKVTTTGSASLPEIGRNVPAAAGYDLHPVFHLEASGPADRLALDLDVTSEAGKVRGDVTADVRSPDLGVRGDVELERLNLAPILKDPAQKTDLTGHAKVDLAMLTQPATAPVADRLRGTFAFSGPRVVAAGYEARNVQVSGGIDGARITLDGRAAAYGGTATARGFIVTPRPGRPLSFDLRGKADRLDLRNLPASTGAPAVATALSVADYHIAGSGQSINGTAALNASTVEGATLADGTTAEFALTPATISYAARGNVANLDLHRIGRAFKVAALAKPAYDSRINGSFDVTGSMPRTPAAPARRRAAAAEAPAPATAAMKLDASGKFTDSELMGGRLPELAFEAHLDRGALSGRADGRFEGFNPGQLAGRKDLEGKVTGTVNANFAVADINAPITPDAITADGKATLAESTVGELRIASADIEGRYASQVGDITKVNVTGPDIKVDASGRLALDRTSDSNLKYHVDAVNIPELAKLAGQTGVGGTAVLDGTLTGNAASLKTTGTLDGSNLSYEGNSALDLNSKYTVTIPELDFAKANVQATTEATFVEVGGQQINSVVATTTYDQQRIDFKTTLTQKTRVLDATGQLVLHPDHQEIHLPELAMRTEGVEWRTAPGSNATVKYRGGGVELEDVRLVSGDQSLDLSGSLASGTQTAAGSIVVRARNVDLQQLETLMLQNRGFGGKLSAEATISGTTAAPKVDGRVEVAQGSFQDYRYDSLVATVKYGGPRIALDAKLQQSPTESITAVGSIPMSLFAATPATGVHREPAAGEGIDLQVKSTAMNLALIQGFTDQITKVAGTLQADVRVTGSGEDPHLNGFIDIKNGTFDVPATGGSFAGLTTRVDLDQQGMHIQRFELLDHHKEKLAIAGDLALHAREVGAVNISIDSDNFELLDNELGDIQVQSALKITGDLRHPRVVGDVRLDAARVEVDRVLQLFYDPYSVQSLPDVPSADRVTEESGSAEQATRTALAQAQQSAAAPGEPQPPETTAPSGGVFDALAMDIHVITPDNLVLRGKNIRPGGPTGTALGNMNLTVGGDLRILKEPGGKIAPLGTVNTVRGTYEFQGRRFDLVRDGTVRLTGSSTINPTLDITATRTIPGTGVLARVHITGTAASPQLTLTSDPPLEESDILALIVFNRPVNELGTGERSSLAATAGGIATGFIAAPLGESIGKALDLDLFEITTTTETGALGAGVTLGQQLGSRAFIKLRQQFGERSSTEFQLEYQLAKFLRFQGTASPEASGAANRINERRIERAGVDLIFFFSY